MVAGIKILLDTPLIFNIILGILILISAFIIGYIDEKKIKLWQEEAELSATVYNPQLRKISNLVKRNND